MGRRCLAIWLIAANLLGASGGCQGDTDLPIDAAVELSFEPSPPVVGTSAVTLKLATNNGEMLREAEVRLEANMNHAGMKPSFAQLTETAPGIYQGNLEFTMGGDWFVLVQVSRPDGSRLERKIDIHGVRSL